MKSTAVIALGAGAPWVWTTRKAAASSLPTVFDPLYTAPVLDPAVVPQFFDPLPVIGQGALSSLRVDATTGNLITAVLGPTSQDLLGGGLGLMTPVWGYGIDGGPVTFPGATFVARSGVPVHVEWVNQLGFQYLLRRGADPSEDVIDRTLHWAFGDSALTFANDGVPAVSHLHGGHTDSDFDGLPEHWFTQGMAVGDHYVTNFYTYDGSQEAATLWYHDHGLGMTRTNVYAGLAGFYFIRDDNEDHLLATDRLPTGDREIELVIQDRMFYPDGRLAFPDAPHGGPPSIEPEFFGQIILVNGKAWPLLDVEPVQYRFRLLNGADSRVFDLWLDSGSRSGDGPPLWVIGNDQGLLNAPVAVDHLVIAPGERYDVVVDFRHFAGATLRMRNIGRTPFPKGDTVDPRLDGRVMAFRVSAASETDPTYPIESLTDLRPLAEPLSPSVTAGVPVRKLMLFEGTDAYGRLQPLLGTVDPSAPVGPDGNPGDGTQLWDDPVTETPALGATEVWEVYNATEDAHPIHPHLVATRIVGRQRFRAEVIPKQNVTEDGLVTLGGALRDIRLQGQPKPAEAYEAGLKDVAIMYPGDVTRMVMTFDKPGWWVWHCHILSHEDHEMMRPFRVD